MSLDETVVLTQYFEGSTPYFRYHDVTTCDCETCTLVRG